MINSNDTHTHKNPRQLLKEKKIEKYSTHKGEPVEVVTGSRVLGIPIGNTYFFISYIQGMLQKGTKRIYLVISKLESTQKMTQLLKACTVQKLTHIFSLDILTAT